MVLLLWAERFKAAEDSRCKGAHQVGPAMLLPRASRSGLSNFGIQVGSAAALPVRQVA